MNGDLRARVAESIQRYNMLRRGPSVGVAVSGGADSVVLLHVLHGLAGELGLRLTVLHVNHGLRGEESDGDERFVRNLAESLGLPFATRREAPPARGNLEEQARGVRLRLLFDWREELQLDSIAVGHTRSDQAETVLFRLLRGTGLTGLAAMRPVGHRVIRPLLGIGRDEVRSWARSHGIAWREDSSNQNPRFRRNRLRNETMPQLAAEYNPQLEKALATMAELSQAEEDHWEEETRALFRACVRRHRLGMAVDVVTLRQFPIATQRRVLRRVLGDMRPGLNGLEFEHIEAIRGLCQTTEGHDRVLVPRADALRSFGVLLIARPETINAGPRHYSVEVPVGEERELPFGAGHIYVQRVNTRGDLYDNFKGDQGSVQTAELRATVLATPEVLTVRNWEPGDRLRRHGHSSATKVKLLFQEHRVKLWERRHWPVVVCGGEVAWVRDFGASDDFRATEHGSEAIRIVYRAAE